MGNQYSGGINFYLRADIPRPIIHDLECVIECQSDQYYVPNFSNYFMASQIMRHLDWKYGHYELAKQVQLDEEENLIKGYEFLSLYYKHHEYDQTILHVDDQENNDIQLVGYKFRCDFASKYYIDEQGRDLGKLWYNFLIPYIDQEKYLDKYIGFVKDEDCRYIQYFTFYPEELDKDWKSYYFGEISES